jgi:hypothetical protein
VAEKHEHSLTCGNVRVNAMCIYEWVEATNTLIRGMKKIRDECLDDGHPYMKSVAHDIDEALKKVLTTDPDL